MFDLIGQFYSLVEERHVDWVAKGFLFRDLTVYTINHDTKLLGRIFEMLTEPLLQEIADRNGYTLETPEQQNYYPDFILTPMGESSHRIAVDIKTTYRTYRANGTVSPYKFTLGSYASFLRNGTKNIAYEYDQYDSHYVIGFVYDRGDDAQASRPYALEEIESAPEPYGNVELFIQEKYRISGFGTGSGNTENIGTISSPDITNFRDGNGPFSQMGNEVFELYWRNYPRYKATETLYTGFESFARWVAKSDSVDTELKARVAAYEKTIHSQIKRTAPRAGAIRIIKTCSFDHMARDC